jgi:hypothetical protein
MEDIEETAIVQATHKLLCWFHQVDDIFDIWPHRTGKLERFHGHQNSLHRNIQFNTEIEMATYPLSTLIYTGDWMAPWVIRSTENLLTQTSTCTLDHITIPPSYRPLFLPWFTEPRLFVTGKVFRMSWSTKQIQMTFNPVVRTSKPKKKPTSVTLQQNAGQTEH